MTTRASLMALALALSACAGKPSKTPSSSPSLHLAPTTDLAQAAGVVYLIDVKPRAFLAHAETAAAMDRVISEGNFRHLGNAQAGIDLRELQELVVAHYTQTLLVLGRGTFDPAGVERAFAQEVTVEGRAVDRKGDALGTIARTWGSTADNEREQLAMFGREAIGLEAGRFGPLRIAELFAEERLKRASPALRTEPLARAAAFVGDAPFVLYAAGPFDDTWKRGFGGLLAASTAAAIAIRPASTSSAHDGDLLAITIALFGSWNADADAAASRLAAVVHLIQESALGKLCGADHPVLGPQIRATASEIAVELTVAIDPFFQGIRDATSANTDEILGFTRE